MVLDSDVVQMSCCDRLMCKKCIDNLKNCPGCTVRGLKTQKINRNVKSELNDVLFKCDFCEENFKFEHKTRHE